MSKKLLLSSTALVGAFALATPSYADIEVTLSGQVEFGAGFGDEETVDTDADENPAERGYYFFMDSETKIEAEGAAENGLNYSAKVELETDAIENLNSDETVLALWGGFGRVELGREDGAADNMFLAGEDFQAGTGGIDGDSNNLALPGVADSSDAAKITYFTQRIAGFQLGGSFTPDTGDAEEDNDDGDDFENHVELGANFQTSAGGAEVTVTGVASFGDVEDEGEDDLEDYGIGAGVEFGGIGIGAGYIIKQEADEGDGFTIGAKYGFGPANVSVGYSRDNPDADDQDDQNVIVLAADYTLVPGVKLKGDLAFNDDDSDTGAEDDSTTAGVVTIQVNY